ncbi:universal stress protein [Streptomyces sp. AS02]|uniref:universal stress protein n=1 Tax=Streptomyces sp. AS02 TaxID=2938946 RepID=UPI002021CB45|nr:universal stress protein [Streptomyces sp. AS02]MCL8017084.1 universal stress protein [Streptomyces sp. AS02]
MNSPRSGTPGASLLIEECQETARERLVGLLADVFGARGPGVWMCALVAHGAPGRALVEVADRETDILVAGAGRRGPWHRACHRSVTRYCLTHATCPVLAVPPSPLETELTGRAPAQCLAVAVGHPGLGGSNGVSGRGVTRGGRRRAG